MGSQWSSNTQPITQEIQPGQQQQQLPLGGSIANAAPMDLPQQQLQMPVDMLQQQQQVPSQPTPQRCSSTNRGFASGMRGSRRFSSEGLSSLAPNEHFNDDDEVVHVAGPTGAAAQPEPDPVASVEAVLSVSTRIEYSALPRGETKDIFGLITLQAAAAPQSSESIVSPSSEAERQPMDLMCVLDVSGSMNGEKIQQVKSAVRFVVDQATTKDRLSIVSFQSSASRVMRMRKMDAAGKDEANVSTSRLTAGGGTNIAAGLSMALQVIEQRRHRNKVSAILLLTDGKDSSTRHQLPALLARAQAANCSVYAFGFGRDHDAALLSEMAEQAHTPFTFVEDSDNIREAFAGAVGGLTSMVAQNVKLSIDSRVTLKKAHTGFVVNEITGRGATITIPDMFAGESRNVPVELVVPADAEAHDMTLLEAHVRYTDLRSGALVQTVLVAMTVSRVDEPQPEMEPDIEVTAQRERVEVTQDLQAAARHCDEGNFEEAQRVLDQADQNMKRRKCQSKLSSALTEELADAKGRMRSRSLWEGGGRAEVNDACQMHQMERCTNAFASSSGSRKKSSKSMYLGAQQQSWVKKAKGSD